MPTYTPNFNFALPLVNNPVDANLWGGELNGNLTSQDTLLRSLANCNIGSAAPTSPAPQAGTLWINNSSSTSWPFQIYDGSNWVTVGYLNPVTHSFIVGGGFVNVKQYTEAGNFIYTPTSGTTIVEIEIVGGGGGGGCVLTDGASNVKCSAAGGGAGAYSKGFYNIAIIGASQSITVGAGGVGQKDVIAAGGTGGQTSVGSLLTAPGGTGGGSTRPSFLSNGFGMTQGGFPNGVGTGGFLHCTGQPGSPGIVLNNAYATAGNGGSSFFGGGAIGYSTAGVGPSEGNGTNATSSGAGGAGALMNISASNFAGGNGADGAVIITEYGI